MLASLDAWVRRRARDQCEYCQMHQSDSELTFHIDHVIAEKHGGPTTEDNLALACLHCNLHKGTNLSGIDPVTGRVVELFHPRKDNWDLHFTWRGEELIGRTAPARATIAVLSINLPVYLKVRAILIAKGRFPPKSQT